MAHTHTYTCPVRGVPTRTWSGRAGARGRAPRAWRRQVNCIHYVSFEDLVVLEHERAGQFINNKARLVSQQEARSDAPPTKASFFDEGGIRCNNCPSRGCKECPMFGVGRNPVYRERLEARNARREASGAAAAEAEDARRAEMIENLFDVEGASPEELRGASGAAAMAGGTALADAHAQRGEDAMAADWRGELGADVGAWSGDEDGGDDERLAAPEAAASTAAAFDVLFAEPAPFLLDDIGEDE